MNTQAHCIINLALLGRKKPTRLQAAAIIGAVLPDAPMFLFYIVQKAYFKTAEKVIWSEVYFREGWQNFFDVFNSLPLIGLGWAIAHRLESTWWKVLFASMSLHVLADLPLHHDDGHRHFFPFSHWRFASPISYWDPEHFGHVVGPIEVTLALLACVVVYRSSDSKFARGAVWFIAASYVAFFAYAAVMWL